ncbi:MAG: macrolide ABC transporter ATP-binding protein [Candidatus Latescibacterota bacterium]|nr:MAG: macrolide ABC transporter ATP-binding protein [Candidatus Latescibacterota bacterium]RKY73857.1 MAG: macrolide ABC transporter ATP-binding protein [Candidatus Latescibacterota bacterium]HDI00352.1 ABC transporter ATP-binding protein [Bacillota bacterium]
MIKLVDVRKVYKMGKVDVEALRGIDLEIEEGEYVAVLGPSGSGKSTLMHIIGCLDRPTSGRYYLDGREVSRLSPSQLAEIRNTKVGFVFQSFNLLPHATALENVELPMIYRRMRAKERKKRAKMLLDMLGLGERASHRPSELSGGEQQRVAIARALANDPQILLADEPTGNLDSKSGEEVVKMFDDLWRQGRTIVVVTHDPAVAERAERVVRLLDGRIVQ